MHKFGKKKKKKSERYPVVMNTKVEKLPVSEEESLLYVLQLVLSLQE